MSYDIRSLQQLSVCCIIVPSEMLGSCSRRNKTASRFRRQKKKKKKIKDKLSGSPEVRHFRSVKLVCFLRTMHG